MFTVSYRMQSLKNCSIYLLGDTHIGRVGIADKKLEQAIKLVKKKRENRFVMMGDAVESIFVGDKRYNPAETGGGKYKTADEQCKDVAEIFKPIADKCLAWLDGNHEEKVHAIINTAATIEKYIGCALPHGGRSAKIIISDETKIWATHGNGIISMKAGDPSQRRRNEEIRVKRALRDLQGDCILMAMGHVHKVIVCKPEPGLAIIGDTQQQIYPSFAKTKEGYIPEEYRWYAATGSFVLGQLEGVTTYVEKAMFSPTELGMVEAVIRGGRLASVEKILL